MGRMERKLLAHYIEVDGFEGRTYVRIGKDLESYEEELNPKVDVQRNIRGNPIVSLTGYQAEGKVEQYYCDKEDAIFYFIQNIANKRLTDETCKTHKVDALFDEDGTQIWAYREDCWVVPTSIGGDTSGVQIPFDVYCAGNRIYGTFDPSTKEFTGGGVEPPSGGTVLPLSVFANGVYSANEGMAYNPVVVNVTNSNIEQNQKTLLERAMFGTVENSAVSYLGEFAFAGMSSMTSVRCVNCKSVSNYAFYQCSGLQSVYMPSCSGLGTSCFASCVLLSSLTLSFNGIANVPQSAFYACSSLKTINLPNCSIVNRAAFGKCYKLSSVGLAKCEVVGEYAFDYCSSITTISLPSCTTVSASAFELCVSLTSAYLPKCTSLGAWAFTSCSNLSSVSLPSCVSVGNAAFAACASLSAISLPVCTSIGGSAFSGTKISSLYLPEVTIVAQSALAKMSELRYAELPKCSYINWYTFYSDSKLATVKLSICSNIYNYAFQGCSSLMSLYLLSSSVVVLSSTNVFTGTPMSLSTYTGNFGSIFVTASQVSYYKAATNWNVYSNRITSYTGG